MLRMCVILATSFAQEEHTMLRTLFVFSEIAPYSKTGGLADVGDALPVALGQLGVDTRVLVPYYGCPAMGEMDWRCTVSVPYTDETAELWSLTERPQILFLRYPSYYERDGGPYQNAQGEDWPDNDRRFALLNRVAVEIAQGRVSTLWKRRSSAMLSTVARIFVCPAAP